MVPTRPPTSVLQGTRGSVNPALRLSSSPYQIKPVQSSHPRQAPAFMEVTTGVSEGQLLATYPALSDVQQHQRSCKAKTYFGSCECHSSLLPTSADNCSCPNSASSCTAVCSQFHLLSLTPGRTSVQSVSSREKPPQGSPLTSTAPISTQGTNTITKSKTINTNFRVLEDRGRRWGEGPSMTNIPLMFISCIYCVDDSFKTSFYNEKSFNEFLWS